MKLFFCLSPLFFIGCKDSHKSNNANEGNHNIPSENKGLVIRLPVAKKDRLQYHTTSDTISISFQTKDSLKFSGKEFNDIVDNFPELYDDCVYHPDTIYKRNRICVDLKDSLGNNNHLSFDSEVGQDEYYILYAFFLKHKNGINKYAVRRKNLLLIYNTLNSLFGTLYYGGTYYGHQYSRIEGYAEFSVYWFSHYEDYFDRPYNISKQKQFYIGGLKQLIRDEETIDYNTINRKDKLAREAELFQKVEQLDHLITDNFYLRMAQSFQSDHY